MANLDKDDAYRRAKDYMRMSVWVGFSVSGPGAHLGLPESPLDQDQAVGPQPVSEPSPCRCQQCVPVDPEQGTDLPSLSWGQWDQGYDQLGYA